jgi:hypothetical protein
MAKKSAKKRKATVSRSASEPKFVKTGEAAKAMQKLLDELNEARRGKTGWNPEERFKVGEATLLLKLIIKKLACPPSQSFPRS